MASPPLIKSLLLALKWVRYAAVPEPGPRKYLDPSVSVTSTPILRGSSQKNSSESDKNNSQFLLLLLLF